MIINYNVSGSDRKQLVAAIAEHTRRKSQVPRRTWLCLPDRRFHRQRGWQGHHRGHQHRLTAHQLPA